MPVTRPATSRRPKLHVRRTFSGTLVDSELLIRRGAWIRRVNVEGELVDDSRDERATLWANIGDRLVVSSADLGIDQVAIVEIVCMLDVGYAWQRVGVKAYAGRYTDEMPTGDVFINPVNGIRRTKVQRAA